MLLRFRKYTTSKGITKSSRDRFLRSSESKSGLNLYHAIGVSSLRCKSFHGMGICNFALVLNRNWGKKFGPFLDLCVSSLRRGHANLLCIVPILSDVSEETKVKVNFQHFILLSTRWCKHYGLAGSSPIRCMQFQMDNSESVQPGLGG